MSHPTATNLHRALLSGNEARLRERLAYVQAQGVIDPVVLVLELHDDVARAIDESLGEAKNVAAFLAISDRLGGPAVSLVISCRPVICDLIGVFRPEVAVALAEAGRHGSEIVVVACGAMTLHELDRVSPG